MKTEMKMLNNGNYECVPCAIQHKCVSGDFNWRCTEYLSKKGLHLQFMFGDPYEDGCDHEIEIKYCPFCGYTPLTAKS